MKRPLAALLATCCVLPAFAKDKVFLLTPVTYKSDASVVQRVREECQIEGMLEKDVGSALRKRLSGGTVDSETAAEGATVMRLQISHVLGVGGGAWSGPKALTVYAELLENGKLVRQARINRWSTGGVWGGFKSTCSIINRCSVAIAKDLTRWASDPTYKIEDEAPPKEAAAEDKAAAGQPEAN
jgi:hypothetical protein